MISYILNRIMSNEGLLKSASKYTNVVKGMMQAANPPGRAFVPDRANTAKSQFPVKLASTDPEDDKYFLRQQLVGPDGKIPGVGIAVAPEDFFNYAERKQEENLISGFKSWMMQQADFSTPEGADYWYRNSPWMKEERLREIEREGELQKKLAKIQATGPEDEEDWLVIYMLQQGLIKSLGVPLYEMGMTQAQADRIMGYTPGMFSLFKFLPADVSSPIVGYNDPLNPANNKAKTWSNPFPTTAQVVPPGANPANVQAAIYQNANPSTLSRNPYQRQGL